MNLERYELTANSDYTKFEFTSHSKQGKVDKEIHFQILSDNLYNLAFGDKCKITGHLDDVIVTDNGDTEMVLRTVVSAVYNFFDHYPFAFVLATGSTASRNRMYRMGINKYIDIVVRDFDIAGKVDEKWEPYQKGNSYYAFAVYRKNINFKL